MTTTGVGDEAREGSLDIDLISLIDKRPGQPKFAIAPGQSGNQTDRLVIFKMPQSGRVFRIDLINIASGGNP